jgi:hypothetical protein
MRLRASLLSFPLCHRLTFLPTFSSFSLSVLFGHSFFVNFSSSLPFSFYDTATRHTTLNIPMEFSFNRLYFNCIYFNGRLYQRSYISISDERGKLALRYYIVRIRIRTQPKVSDSFGFGFGYAALMRGGARFGNVVRIRIRI